MLDGGTAFHSSARVGPNAVIQLSNALQSAIGAEATRTFFARQGHVNIFDHPPEEMIEEDIPAALARALWSEFPPETARHVAMDAGQRTADYIIANRIPGAARIVLRIVPARLGANLLLKAIERHAWTFAGSGKCETANTPRHLISIRDNPLALPDCCWHVAVFERLFRRMVSRDAVVRHVSCRLDGKADCTFEIELQDRQREPR